jgi:hypothetical protein
MQKELLFIKIYGYILIAFFVGGMDLLYISRFIEDFPPSHRYFGIVVSFWYLITGTGILMRTKWGYYLFKFFLYFIFIGFPIGTIISYLSLSYMKKNNIKFIFNR